MPALNLVGVLGTNVSEASVDQIHKTHPAPRAQNTTSSQIIHRSTTTPMRCCSTNSCAELARWSGAGGPCGSFTRRELPDLRTRSWILCLSTLSSLTTPRYSSLGNPEHATCTVRQLYRTNDSSKYPHSDAPLAASDHGTSSVQGNARHAKLTTGTGELYGASRRTQSAQLLDSAAAQDVERRRRIH